MNRHNPGAVGDLTRSNFSFIQRTIDKLVTTQPPSIQAVVLFLFVFMFFYMIIITMQGSVLLKTRVQVELTKQQLDKRRATITFPKGQPNTNQPPTGNQRACTKLVITIAITA
jgi:hypothetical protein